MSKCTINLDDIGHESRDKPVFYASSTEIVYREDNFIKLASCDGEVLSQIGIPIDVSSFEMLDLLDTVLFIFGGQTLVFMDKSGMAPTQHELGIMSIGNCCTPIFPSTNMDAIIFGTHRDNYIQFVTYDFVQQKRLIQTMSWDMSNITHTYVDKTDMLYSILDQSLLIKANMKTGESETRFETGQINRSYLPYKGMDLYGGHTCLRGVVDRKVKTTKIPLVRVHTLEHIIGDRLYFTSKGGTHVCCYDLKSESMKWEIFGNQIIHETILVKGLSKDKECDVMVIRIDHHIGLINLTEGKSVAYIKCPNVSRIRQTGDNVLVNKANGTAMLIPGVDNDLD